MTRLCGPLPAIGFYDFPETRWRHRHVDVLDSGVGVDRIDDGVDHRRRRADGAGFARSLHAERIGLARAVVEIELDVRHHIGAWERIIHEAAAQQLAGIAVVDRAFGQRLPYALADAAVDLALQQQRVERP